MKKQLLLLTLLLAALSVSAQVYYNKQPGWLTLLPSSVVVPAATVKSDTVLTNPERLFPVSTEFQDRVNYVFAPSTSHRCPPACSPITGSTWCRPKPTLAPS